MTVERQPGTFQVRVIDRIARWSFLYLETYTVLAFDYLVLTFTLSPGVKLLENRLNKGGKGS